MKRWESLIFFQCIFYWKKRFSPKTLLTWHFPKKYFAVQVSRTLNSNCAAGTMKVDDRPELPPVQRAHIFYPQPCSYWKYLFFFFPTILLRANYFPSPVQHSIRLHVRWLWLMVVILFGHNVALLGNWRWVQGWEKAFLNLMLLRQIEPLCSFSATSWLPAYTAYIQVYWSLRHTSFWLGSHS